MQIEKITRHFYNKDTKDIDENLVYKISYKSLMVMEEDLAYAIRKMMLYAHYKKLITLK